MLNGLETQTYGERLKDLYFLILGKLYLLGVGMITLLN